MKFVFAFGFLVACTNAFPYENIEAGFEELTFDEKSKDFINHEITNVERDHVLNQVFTTAEIQTTDGWNGKGQFETTVEGDVTTATEMYTTGQSKDYALGTTDVYSTGAQEETTGTIEYSTADFTTGAEKFTSGRSDVTTAEGATTEEDGLMYVTQGEFETSQGMY